MLELENHLIGVDQGDAVLFSDFEDGGPMWTGKGPREARIKVRFSRAFRAKPALFVSLAMFDMDQKTNQRADLSYERLTHKSFDLVFRTWGDTRVARARANWMAVGPLDHEDQWDIA